MLINDYHNFIHLTRPYKYGDVLTNIGYASMIIFLVFSFIVNDRDENRKHLSTLKALVTVAFSCETLYLFIDYITYGSLLDNIRFALSNYAHFLGRFIIAVIFLLILIFDFLSNETKFRIFIFSLSSFLILEIVLLVIVKSSCLSLYDMFRIALLISIIVFYKNRKSE